MQAEKVQLSHNSVELTNNAALARAPASAAELCAAECRQAHAEAAHTDMLPATGNADATKPALLLTEQRRLDLEWCLEQQRKARAQATAQEKVGHMEELEHQRRYLTLQGGSQGAAFAHLSMQPLCVAGCGQCIPGAAKPQWQKIACSLNLGIMQAEVAPDLD